MKESVLRTVVPIVVGLLVRFGVQDWLGADDATMLAIVQAVVTAGYYLVVRVAEHVGSSKWGWLLGYPSAPSYAPRHAVDPAPTQD